MRRTYAKFSRNDAKGTWTTTTPWGRQVVPDFRIRALGTIKHLSRTRLQTYCEHWAAYLELLPVTWWRWQRDGINWQEERRYYFMGLKKDQIKLRKKEENVNL